MNPYTVHSTIADNIEFAILVGDETNILRRVKLLTYVSRQNAAIKLAWLPTLATASGFDKKIY